MWMRLTAILAVATLLASSCAYIARVSVTDSGEQADGHSGGSSTSDYPPSLSADGRYVAFVSSATNLVPDDTNGSQDVFVRDAMEGTTTRVSVDSGGDEGHGDSRRPAISADGRYVAFHSIAPDLVPGDTNAAWDVFVHDVVTGSTTRVSLDSGGAEVDADSARPAISADGRFVAFDSVASNLVVGDTNDVSDVFVRDRDASVTTRISLDSAGVEGNGQSGGKTSIAPLRASAPQSISSDGRHVAFTSRASNLVAGDTNGVADVFVRDTMANTTTRVSVDGAGGQFNRDSHDPAISANGRYVAFAWYYSGGIICCVGVSLRDTAAGTTTEVTGTSGWGAVPALSADGRYVAFWGLGHWGAGIGLYDVVGGTTDHVSVDLFGEWADQQVPASGSGPAISADGRYVAFDTNSTDLVPNDTNDASDVFVKRTVEPSIASLSPVTGRAGRSLTVTVDGSGFADVTQALFSGEGMTVTSVTVVSDTQLQLGVTIDRGASPTARTLTLVDPGTLGPLTGAAGQCTDCFTPTG